MERYPEAVAAFRRSAQSPRGNGEDYLRIAESMRFLPEARSGVSAVQVRGEALKLTDFASAAMAEEVRVRGWASGKPPQLIELLARLSELKVLSRHALLYPLTFLTLGLQGLIELVAMALGLIVFVSYPRLSRRTWRASAGITVVVVALPMVAMTTRLPVSFGAAASAAWLGQSAVRLFFVLAGAVVLSPVVGMRGLDFSRTFGRSWRRGRLRDWIGAAWPVLGAAFLLALVGLAAGHHGRAPTLYLQRLPTLLTGGEFGAIDPEVTTLARFSLLLYHVLRTELLARGFLLALLAFLLRRYRHARVAAVVAGAVLWSLLTAGSMEPPLDQLLVGLAQGLVLGWVRLRQGFDGALVAHAAACVVTGGAV
jgi:hypothetical protein